MRRRRLPALIAGLWLLSACDVPAPDRLGARDGRLAPCPDTPNCVNTGDRHPEGTPPLYLVSPDAAVFDSVRSVVASMSRMRVVSASGRYLHAEERSRLFRFVDDLELLAASDGELVVRSASRVGRSDLGVNRRRVERLRALLERSDLLR